MTDLQTLKDSLDKLNSNDRTFATSLLASAAKYGSLTPKQDLWAGKLVEKANKPAFTVVASYPASQPAHQEPVTVGSFDGVVALFATAKQHLKFPKIALSVAGKTVKLSLAGPKSKLAGNIVITSNGSYGNAAYYGRVTADGALYTSSKAADFKDALTAVLTALGENPAKVAKEHGKLLGVCCFCHKPIGTGEDQRSVAVGFGPHCAEHYGLKAQWLTGDTSSPKVAAKLGVEAALDLNTGVPDFVPAINPYSEPVVPTLTVSASASKLFEDIATGLADAQAKLEAAKLQAIATEVEQTTASSQDEVDYAELEAALVEQQGTLQQTIEDALDVSQIPVNVGPCVFCGAPGLVTLHEQAVCRACVKELSEA